jgi:hypothetical protein
VQVFLEPGCHGFPPLLTGKGLGLLTASYINQGGKWRREWGGGEVDGREPGRAKKDVDEVRRAKNEVRTGGQSGKELRSEFRVWIKWQIELRSEKGVDEVGNGIQKWEMEFRSVKGVDEVGNGIKK